MQSFKELNTYKILSVQFVGLCYTLYFIACRNRKCVCFRAFTIIVWWVSISIIVQQMVVNLQLSEWETVIKPYFILLFPVSFNSFNWVLHHLLIYNAYSESHPLQSYIYNTISFVYKKLKYQSHSMGGRLLIWLRRSFRSCLRWRWASKPAISYSPCASPRTTFISSGVASRVVPMFKVIVEICLLGLFGGLFGEIIIVSDSGVFDLCSNSNVVTSLLVVRFRSLLVVELELYLFVNNKKNKLIENYRIL